MCTREAYILWFYRELYGQEHGEPQFAGEDLVRPEVFSRLRRSKEFDASFGPLDYFILKDITLGDCYMAGYVWQ